ncbi:MAG: hypothetical protein KIS96_06950 [Bauldia sp.]|nr:hypothetical protein [Bauldia sp.]
MNSLTPPDEPVDIFVHISRSAGSTVRSIVSREYGVERVLYFEQGSRSWTAHHDGGVPLADQVREKGARFITGHHPFGLHELIDRPTRYFAAIREPVTRLMSHHTAVLAQPRNRFHRRMVAEAPTIEEFFANPDLAPGHHLATMLAGTRAGGADVVEAAIENMRHRFAVVMLAERFDESLLLLARDLGWRVPLYRIRNVTPTSVVRVSKLDAVADEFRETYRDRFAPDLAVYAEAERLLDARVAEGGPALTAAVAAMEEMTEAINILDPHGVFEGYAFRRNDVLPEGAAKLIGSEPYRAVEAFLADRPVTASAGSPDRSSPTGR